MYMKTNVTLLLLFILFYKEKSECKSMTLNLLCWNKCFPAFCSLQIICKSQMASTQRTVSQTERGRKWRWESETVWLPGPALSGRSSRVRCLLSTRDWPAIRAWRCVWVVYIYNYRLPSIYNNYHPRPSLWFGRHMGLGVCWSVIIRNVVISTAPLLSSVLTSL